MEFGSANSSVVKSIKQRDLLNTWLRAYRKRRALPPIEEYQPDRIEDELIDMMRFDVVGAGDQARFLITHEGSRLTVTYGSEHIDPDKRTNRYLDDAIGPLRYGRVIESYKTCVARRRPAYSVAMVKDADGKDVAYERLLLPFGRGNTVTQIVGSYKTISIEGGFKVRDLMSLDAVVDPVIMVRAVIDLDIAGSSAVLHGPDDVVELV